MYFKQSTHQYIIGDNNFKIPVGAEFFIGKQNDKKLKMKVI